jgi:hypothetical protein
MMPIYMIDRPRLKVRDQRSAASTVRIDVQTRSNEQELARARLVHRLSIAVAVAAVALLGVGFGLQWKPWFQAPDILLAAAAVEWQRRCGHKVKTLLEEREGPDSARMG